MTDNNEETKERVETKREISGEELQKGRFGFRLKDATPEDEQAFFEQVQEAAQNGQNMYFSNNVEIVDLAELQRAPQQAEPESNEENSEDKSETEDAATSEDSETNVEPEPQQAPQPAARQPWYGPNGYMVPGQHQPYNYDPFTGMPLRAPQPQQPAPQPTRDQAYQPNYAELMRPGYVPPQQPQPQYNPYNQYGYTGFVPPQPQQNPNAESPQPSQTKKQNQ